MQTLCLINNLAIQKMMLKVPLLSDSSMPHSPQYEFLQVLLFHLMGMSPSTQQTDSQRSEKEILIQVYFAEL